MKYSVSFVLFAVLLALTSPASADSYTYKWKANDGTTQYTQVPPTDRPYTRVKISSSSTKLSKQQTAVAENKPAISENASAGEKALAETEAVAQKEKVKIAQQRATACEQAKKNLVIMKSRPRIRIPMSNGEYKVLSEEEKQTKIKETKQIILDSCS